MERLEHAGAEAADREVLLERQDARAGPRDAPQQLQVERLGEARVGDAAGDAALAELLRPPGAPTETIEP